MTRRRNGILHAWWNEREWEDSLFSRIVIPSAVEGSLHRSGILHAGGHVKIAWDHWFHVILPSSFYRCARKISRLRSKWRDERSDCLTYIVYLSAEGCLFEALYPPPLARPFFKGLLSWQGKTNP